MKLILDEWIVREVIDTLYMARTTFLGITGLDSPQEVEKKSANETAITRRISKAIDLIQQSEQSPVPNDLEEAAKKYQESVSADTTIYYCGADEDVYFANRIVDAFKAGAKWQANHTPLPEDTVLFNKGVAEGRRLERDEFEKNRLAACGDQTKEEYDRETDFALEIIKKEHRQPTFSDAINYGMRLQKEQMMDEWLKDRDGCFWDGVAEGKKAMEKQMLDEARNHFVYNILSGNDMKKMIEIYNDEADCRPGDVVRVIIVKE